jgi:hypothetical protein
VDAWQAILTTVGGAFSATLGVVAGGLVTRRAQQRHWLRDRQLKAYDDLFAQYARFMMQLNQAHASRQPATVDWASWSVSLTSASLVAPAEVAASIDEFGRAIDVFLGVVAARNPAEDPVEMSVFQQAATPAADAHLALLNVIRRSMGGRLGDLPFYLGGSLVNRPA